MIRFNDIAPGVTFPPPVEQQRLSRISRDRALFLGDRVRTQTEQDTTPEEKIVHNWHRRIPTFFAEFLFGERPVITIDGPAQAWIDSLADNLSDVMFRVLIDTIRYGTGVSYIDPNMPEAPFRSIEPDGWFAVEENGAHAGDILVYVGEGSSAIADQQRYSGDRYSPPKVSRTLKIIKVSSSEWVETYHTWERGSKISAAFEESRIPISTRVVFQLFNGYPVMMEGVSVYDDITKPILEIENRMTGLSKILRRNERPHMFGPAAAVETDARGNKVVNSAGQFFPLETGDAEPGYITWDSKLDGVKLDLLENRNAMLALSGLSPILFDMEQTTGIASGVALRRMAIPFVSKVALLKRHCERMMRDLILAANANSGGVVLSIDRTDIEFEWSDRALFEDPTAPDEPADPEEGDA